MHGRVEGVHDPRPIAPALAVYGTCNIKQSVVSIHPGFLKARIILNKRTI